MASPDVAAPVLHPGECVYLFPAMSFSAGVLLSEACLLSGRG